jgi:hypothetical protein
MCDKCRVFKNYGICSTNPNINNVKDNILKGAGQLVLIYQEQTNCIPYLYSRNWADVCKEDY